MLTVYHFQRGPLGNNMFLLVDELESRAAIVDPGIDSEDILEFCAGRDWRIELIINTHAHFDHVYNNALFAAQTGSPIALHRADLPLLRNLQETCRRWGMPVPEASPEPAILLEHGAVLEVFSHNLEVRHTPGHSPGQVALIIGRQDLIATTLRPGQSEDTAEGMDFAPYSTIETAGPVALVGDTLFRRGVGRWDLPLASWAELERSITEQLFTLPEGTRVLCGHGDFTTIGEEKRHNPFVGAGARLIPKV